MKELEIRFCTYREIGYQKIIFIVQIPYHSLSFYGIYLY